jgi:hypothetical protein
MATQQTAKAAIRFTGIDAVFCNLLLLWIAWVLWTGTFPFEICDILTKFALYWIAGIQVPSVFWTWPGAILLCVLLLGLLRVIGRAVCLRPWRSFIPVPRTWRHFALATAILPLIALAVAGDALWLACTGGRTSDAATLDAAIADAGLKPVNVHLPAGAFVGHISPYLFKSRSRHDVREDRVSVWANADDVPLSRTVAVLWYRTPSEQPDPREVDAFSGIVVVAPVTRRMYFGPGATPRIPLFLAHFVGHTTVRGYVAPAAILALLVLAAYGALLARVLTRGALVRGSRG